MKRSDEPETLPESAKKKPKRCPSEQEKCLLQLSKVKTCMLSHLPKDLRDELTKFLYCGPICSVCAYMRPEEASDEDTRVFTTNVWGPRHHYALVCPTCRYYLGRANEDVSGETLLAHIKMSYKKQGTAAIQRVVAAMNKRRKEYNARRKLRTYTRTKSRSMLRYTPQ
jgi:hypothetical protein